METSKKPVIKEALEAAERQYPNNTTQNNAMYFLVVALVFAVCEVADGIKQLVADLPNHE
jgi:hypothetical protein